MSKPDKPLEPPTRLITIMCYLIGAAIFAPALMKGFGKIGLAVGLLLGAALGAWLSGWIKRTFLEF